MCQHKFLEFSTAISRITRRIKKALNGPSPRRAVCLAPTALSHPSLGHRPRHPISNDPSAESANQLEVNRAFSAHYFEDAMHPGAECPRLAMSDAPLPLTRYDVRAARPQRELASFFHEFPFH